MSRGPQTPSSRDDSCTTGDDALTVESEAWGLNHHRAGCGSALFTSLGKDGLVHLWPSRTLDLTPGHCSLLPPSGIQTPSSI